MQKKFSKLKCFIWLLYVTIVANFSLFSACTSEDEGFVLEDRYYTSAQSRMTRSETEPTPNTFPSREQILANQTVLAHMQELWNLTKNDANESEKRERGCYILYYGGQDYRFVDKEGGWYPSTSSSHLYWSVETELTNDEKTRLCAFFHTHTTMQYVSSDSARKVGPSGRDTSISMASYLPGFVYDYCGDNDTINSPYGFVWGNTSTDADAKIYEFGQNTRLPH